MKEFIVSIKGLDGIVRHVIMTEGDVIHGRIERIISEVFEGIEDRTDFYLLSIQPK